MYNTVDSISYQLAILHMPGVIYMPSRNGPEHIFMARLTYSTSFHFSDLMKMAPTPPPAAAFVPEWTLSSVYPKCPSTNDGIKFAHSSAKTWMFLYGKRYDNPNSIACTPCSFDGWMLRLP